jgi:hypothetical protein
MKTQLRLTAPLTALTLVALLAVATAAAQQPALTTVATAHAPLPVIMHAPSLLDSIDTIAGQRVRILDARVLEVIEPRVILVEANTHYRALRGQRDRFLVFVSDGSDANGAQLAMGSRVIVEGTARTLLSIRTTSDVSWPASLDSDDVKDLEVRGAVIRAAILTAEDTAVAGSLQEVRRSGGIYRR